MLNIGPEFTYPDGKARKLIHYAACCEGDGPLKLLISKGVDINEIDGAGLTPLMYAAYNGRVKNVRVLLNDSRIKPE